MSDPVDQISQWVPVKIVTGAFFLVTGWLFKLVMERAKKTEARIETLEKWSERGEDLIEALTKDLKTAIDTIKDNRAEIAILAKRLEILDKDLATRTMLGSLGDRLDGRITNIAQELAVLKAVVSERTATEPKRKR